MNHLYLLIFSLFSFTGFSQYRVGHHVTSATECDGIVHADSSFNEGNLQWLDENLNIISTGYLLDSICAGNYGLTGLPVTFPEDTLWIEIFDLDTYVLELWAGDVQHDYNNTCSGSAAISSNVDLWPPFNLEYLQGEEASFGYCSDVYSIIVTDAAGLSGQLDFVILGGDNVYGPPIDSLPTDTLIGETIENCFIDYNSIDSVQLSALVNADSSVIIHWTVYQTDGSVTDVYDTLSYNGEAGIYYVEMIYYCPNKSTGQLAGFRGAVNLPSIAELDVNELSDSWSKVYPNPFKETIALSFKHSGNYYVVLTDASGRMILEKNVKGNSELLEASGLKAGVYFISVSNGTDSFVKKIVKN